MDEVTSILLFLFTVLRHREASEMRTNINTQNQRNIGIQSERGQVAQMFRTFRSLLSLSIERLCRFVWSVPHAIYTWGMPAATARANPKGIARIVTQHLRMLVDTLRHVPSLGTDQAYRSGLIAS